MHGYHELIQATSHQKHIWSVFDHHIWFEHLLHKRFFCSNSCHHSGGGDEQGRLMCHLWYPHSFESRTSLWFSVWLLVFFILIRPYQILPFQGLQSTSYASTRSLSQCLFQVQSNLQQLHPH
jgi:hypothetical protein